MPNDYLYLSWNFKDVARGKQVLDRCGLTGEATFSLGSFNPQYCTVRLPRSDPRLLRLRAELAVESDSDGHPRFDREYTKKEIAAAAFVKLIVATAGLTGSANYPNQKWGRSAACLTCGAGARPVPPIHIHTSKMGKKKLDCTAHDSQIIVTTELAESLQAEGLTGFRPREVCSPSGKPDARWKWLDIEYVWPPVDRPDLLYRENPCPQCGRAGHYADWGRPIAFVHRTLPKNVPDFSHALERFGNWFHRTPGDMKHNVGGGAATILSARARDALQRHKVARIAFEPVFEESNPLIAQWPMQPWPMQPWPMH